MTEDRALSALRAADPAPPHVDHRPTPESEALLERILASPGPGSGTTVATDVRPRRVRRAAVGLVLVLATLALVALPTSRLLGGGGGDDGSAQAATPTPLSFAAPTRGGARAQLRAIARRVEGLPADVGSGPVAEVDYRSWSLFTRVDGVDVTSRVVPEQVTRTVAADGTGRTVTRLLDDDGEVRETVTTADGWPVARLPASTGEMDTVLRTRNPSSPAGRFNAVVETLVERPAGPGARAAVLRWLADTRGIATVGPMADRLGRPGTGFTVESAASGLPTRYLVVVDPEDGRMLGYEEMLTADPGRLGVPIPSVIAYVAWQDARYVED